MDLRNEDTKEAEADVTGGFGVEMEGMEMDGRMMISHNRLSVSSESK